ncbi:response regulator [Occultella aeris]|uniref:KDP operon transcriptional regulatory protein KdpE n=1 Tax=Occultella aeris TaxID=2761496 RepID=A0A7M4DPR5_9MICO|nr:response regulator [Occultella aeris]VZO39459.1 KDP operon transcriptional regulatory protein KdpE [Occultella aeris]
MTRVLIVDDEPALARALAVVFRANRYEAQVATTGAAAVQAVTDWHPDAVVLDLGLPDLDGMDVLRAIRSWSSLPIVVLSARQTSDDKVEALDAGADDYVTKPFGTDELLARIRAAVRRRPAEEDPPVVRAEAFTVDLALRRVTLASGETVRLTPTEWHLLELLTRNVGKIVGRRELLQELRGPNLDAETHYLRVYMAQLRRKLEPDPARPRHLITEAGVGYRLQP